MECQNDNFHQSSFQGSQYKNLKIFQNLALFYQDYGVNATHHFSATGLCSASLHLVLHFQYLRPWKDSCGRIREGFKKYLEELSEIFQIGFDPPPPYPIFLKTPTKTSGKIPYFLCIFA